MKKYIFVCQNCYSRNYHLTISSGSAISLQKYCAKCRKKTLHTSSL